MITSDYAFQQNAFQISILTNARRKTAANQEQRVKRIAAAEEAIAALRLFASYKTGRVADIVNAQADVCETVLAAALRGDWQ